MSNYPACKGCGANFAQYVHYEDCPFYTRYSESHRRELIIRGVLQLVKREIKGQRE